MVTAKLEARRIFLLLLFCIATLTIAGLGVVIARFGLDHGQLLGFSARFDLNREGNVPAYYSALQLAFAAVLLAFIALAKRSAGAPFARHWLILCVIFGFLSFDEASELHERLREPMLAYFDLKGAWAYAWYFPYGILVVFFLIAYWRFFWHLPTRIRMLVAAACATYVGAAIGLELLQIHFVVTADYGAPGELYAALAYSAEESAEMLGIAVFVYALLRYAAEEVGTVRLEFATVSARLREGAGQEKRSPC